jgi:hypothetical protein
MVADTLVIHSRDTVFMNDPRISEHYLEILEKTNNQLGLWYGPYEVMLAALSILFTALGLGAAYIIYRQSSDFKREHETAIESYKIVIDGYINEAGRQLEALSEELRNQKKDEIERATAELQKTDDPQKVTALEQRISELELEQSAMLARQSNLNEHNVFIGRSRVTTDHNIFTLVKALKDQGVSDNIIMVELSSKFKIDFARARHFLALYDSIATSKSGDTSP